MMVRKYFMLVLFLKLYKADIALRHSHNNSNVIYGKPPKAWEIYIKAFLFNFVRSSIKQDNSLPLLLYRSGLQSHSFINHSQRNMNKFHIIKHPNYEVNYILDEVKTYYFQINLASGQIYLLNPTIINLRTYTFSFNLVDIFTLNTTFHKLIFFQRTKQV